MVFLVQNSQNRDAAAFQAKLDELIRAVEQAREPLHRHRAYDRHRNRGKIRAELERECEESPTTRQRDLSSA